MRLNEKFLGCAKLSPSDPITAGQLGTWEIEYTVGRYGIDDRGTIKIAWRNVSDWARPQFDDPMGLGYTTVTTTGNAKVRIENAAYQRPFIKSVMVYVYDGYLYEGDKIKVVFGDRSKGSLGIRAQSFREYDHEFKILVDPYGTRKYKELPSSLKVDILGGKPHELQVLAPSIIQKGEAFDMVLRCIDEYGNPALEFEGEVEVQVLGLEADAYVLAQNIVFTREDQAVKRIGGNRVFEEGILHISASCRRLGFAAISNGLSCEEVSDFKLYWGDMHGQTQLTIGTGTMDEYYAFARDFGAVDFSGWQGNDFEIDHDKWKEVREKTQAYNDPGSFLTFLGYEWSGVTSGGGDHNIFFLEDSDKFFPSSNWLAEGKGLDVEDNAYPISELWGKFGDRQDVMAIPHVGGRHGNFDYFNPAYIKLVEVHSHHGTFDWFALEAMKREMKVGFVGSSDDHTCRMGISYPLSRSGTKVKTSFDVISGLVGVYAEELTKKSVWEALMARRCYATTFNRLNLKVTIGGHYMGEEIDLSAPPVMDIKAIGSSPIENIQIYNGTELLADHHLLEVCENRSNIRKLKIVWSGVRVRTRSKSADWTGMISVDKARILDAREICFDRIEQGIKLKTDQVLNWSSSTSGDIDGIELTVDADPDATLSFVSGPIQFEIDVDEVSDVVRTFDAGGENLKVEVSSANVAVGSRQAYMQSLQAQMSYQTDVLHDGFNAYWVKVIQEDGNMAWSSPIFVNKK